MSKFVHLVNKDGILVYSQVLRDFVQLARLKIYTELSEREWCDRIKMPLSDYADKVILDRLPLTKEDLTNICTFCGTSVKELLDEVHALGKEVEDEGILTFVWDMEEVRKSFEVEGS